MSLLAHVLLLGTLLASSSAQSCSSCNCQVNNVDVLDSVVDSKLDARFTTSSESRRPGCCLCRQDGVSIFEANLTTGSYTIEPGHGLSWLNTLTGSGNCNMQGVLNISLPLPVSGIQRRFLQFHLYFSNPPTGYNFLISDAYNSNAHGGEAAEVNNQDRQLQVVANVRPGYRDYTVDGHYIERLDNAISNYVTITIGDEYILFDNHRGAQRVYESGYLFLLSGQTPSSGQRDHDIYFGMNRVVQNIGGVPSANRIGTGLCRAVIKAFDC